MHSWAKDISNRTVEWVQNVVEMLSTLNEYILCFITIIQIEMAFLCVRTVHII